MKNLLQNHIGCDLMVWETQPRKRNKNNEVKFYVDDNQAVNEKDIIIGAFEKERMSNYKIIEIKERRKGSLKGKDYLTVLVKWSSKLVDFSKYNLFVNNTFREMYSLK